MGLLGLGSPFPVNRRYSRVRMSAAKKVKNHRQHGVGGFYDSYDQPAREQHRQRRFVKKKNRTNNVLAFPRATRPAEREDPDPSTVFFQVGTTRFAIHMWCESLPPAPRQRMFQVTSTPTDPIPLPPERERRGPDAWPKTSRKPSLVKTFPAQIQQKPTATRVFVSDAKE